MRIAVGSTNNTKIEAVKQAFSDHEKFAGCEVVGVAVEIEEFGHPKTLEETVRGAMERATKAFQNCEYSVGIEAGLMEMPYSKTGYVELSACAIYDGKQHHLGLSPGFEWPKEALHYILNEGLDGSQAVKAAGITTHEKLGTAGGIIRMLTDGSIDRTLQNKLAVQTALIHVLHPEFF